MPRSSPDYLLCHSCHREYFKYTAPRRCPHCGSLVRLLPRDSGIWLAAFAVSVFLIATVIEMAHLA